MSKLILKSPILAAGLFFILLATKCYGFVDIKVVDANYNPMPLIMFKFVAGPECEDIAETISKKVAYDLQNSGAFAVTNTEVPTDFTYKTDLLKSQSISDDFKSYPVTIFGKVVRQNGIYNISYIVWDNNNNEVMLYKGFKLSQLSQLDITHISHFISGVVYHAFTGEDNYFNSKVAFVNNKSIYIMDYDGENKQLVVSSKHNLYTPNFSYGGRYIAYISLTKGMSEIYIYDFKQKKSFKLGNFKSLVLAPRFSKDDSNLIFAVSRNGVTNIFRINLMTKNITQLTYSDSINIPGGYSPDGSHIVFTSDRKGSPQIFMMKDDGTDVQQISGASKGAYYTPRWSPRGDYIAFTKIQKGGKFIIGIMKPDGTGEREVTQDLSAEGPSWGANGRNIIYQFVYDYVKHYYAFYLVNIFNNYKLLLQPFPNVKDPAFSYNITYPNIIQSEYTIIAKSMIRNLVKSNVSDTTGKDNIVLEDYDVKY